MRQDRHPVAGADSHRDDILPGEQPVPLAADETEEPAIIRELCRSWQPVMGVDDAAELSGRLGAGQQVGGGARRQGHDQAVSLGKGEAIIAELQAGRPGIVELYPAYPAAESDRLAKLRECRRDECPIEASLRQIGRAGRAANQECALQDGPEQPSGAFIRRSVEDRQGERFDERLVERMRGRHDIGDPVFGSGEGKPEERQIMTGAGARNTCPSRPQPPGQAVGCNGPGPPITDVPKAEPRRVGQRHQPVRCVQPLQIPEDLPVCAEDKMAAIVDLAVEPLIVIGPAPAAGARCGLIDPHRPSRLDEPGGGGEAGHAGAENMGDAVAGSWRCGG